ncbi:MAG: septum site-determining protein MinC [Pseudomonadota bacterium]
MGAVSVGHQPAVFDIKSASLTLVALVLKEADLGALEREFGRRFGASPDFFNHDPVVIDLGQLRSGAAELDLPGLLALLRRYRMAPVAVRGGTAAQIEAALAAGLGEVPDPSGPAHQAPTLVQEVVVQEVVREVPAAPVTMVVDKPLRSGQQIYAKGADLVVLALVSYGAEVIADGSIHVYAPLRGKAIAGATGNAGARIFATCMEPELISIAGIYRTTETPLPKEVLGKPAQIRLDGERLLVEAIKL